MIKHPSQPGWLIETSEIKARINAPHRLIMPDNSMCHPLHFYTPDFLPGELEKVRSWAIGEINRQAQAEVVRRGILTNELFFAANVSDIGFLVTEWRGEGRPSEPDPTKYYRAYREAAAYAESSDPTMTPYKMLLTWEAQWNWMRQGFADLNYTRRLALERIKLATTEADIAAALAGLGW